VHSSGQVTDEVIKRYLESQKHDDEDFEIET
jgi:REP element-mobilizing transposase RayT